jgi:hypothetical protein
VAPEDASVRRPTRIPIAARVIDMSLVTARYPSEPNMIVRALGEDGSITEWGAADHAKTSFLRDK